MNSSLTYWVRIDDNNSISGAYSAILGGSGNNDNGLDYVGIFGQNINNPALMTANTFHTNCMILQNLQPGNPANCAPPPGTVPGSLYYVVIPPFNQCSVWIA